MWIVLAVVAGLSLIVFWTGKNAVWGGMSIGLVVGLIIALVYAISGSGFHWTIIGKGAVIGTLAGLVSELVWRVANRGKVPKDV